MINGVGYSEYFPDMRELGYLTWALAETSLEHVTKTTSSLDRIQEYFRSSGIPLHGNRLSPFTETVVLDTLGVDSAELEARIRDKEDTRRAEDHVLMFARSTRGDSYTSLGDILGSSGYPVTVASPDISGRQRQEHANPGITYVRKSMGELDENDANPGFKLAIIGNDGGRMNKDDVFHRRGGQTVRFSPEERLRGVLRVIQPAGRLIVSNTIAVRHIHTLMDSNSGLADEILSSYNTAYLRAYAINKGRPHAVDPLLVFERREA